jgi:hypothetical protein
MTFLLMLLLMQSPVDVKPEAVPVVEAIPIPKGATLDALTTTLKELQGVRDRAAIQEGAITFSLGLLEAIALEQAGLSGDTHTMDWSTLTLIPKVTE